MDEQTRNVYTKYNINPDDREDEFLKEYYAKIEKKEHDNELYFRKIFDNGIEINYPSLKNYISGIRREPVIFVELNSKIYEVIMCLIVEANSAAITLCNHMLERLLKLALIKNKVGLGPVSPELWNDTYSAAHLKYHKSDMYNNIKSCHEEGLITDDERDELHGFRKQIRNGFSHFDPIQILSDLPDVRVMHHGKFSKPDEAPIPISFMTKTIPAFQAFQVDNFASETSHLFFDFLFNLIINIEKRLQIKNY